MATLDRANPRPRLVRARDAYRSRRRDVQRAPLADWAFLQYGTPTDLPRRGELVESITTQAEVDDGRWLARCPFCPSAQVVSLADPRFLCAACANAVVEGAFVAVDVPDAALVDEVEDVLMRRERRRRNWRPGEQLTEENDGLD